MLGCATCVVVDVENQFDGALGSSTKGLAVQGAARPLPFGVLDLHTSYAGCACAVFHVWHTWVDAVHLSGRVGLLELLKAIHWKGRRGVSF